MICRRRHQAENASPCIGSADKVRDRGVRILRQPIEMLLYVSSNVRRWRTNIRMCVGFVALGVAG